MRFHVRGFASLLLAITFLILGFSGVILYMTPKGRVAHWTGWTMLGLEKEEWSGLHINFALLFLAVAGLHWFLNWKPFWSYLKARKARRLNLVTETVVTIVVALLFFVCTIWLVPPFSTVLLGNSQIQAYWEEHSPRPPAPHAEEFKLRRFASTIGLSLDEVKEALRKEGYVIQSDFVTVGQLAEEHGGVPSDVLAAVQKHFPTAGSKPPGCQGRRKHRVP
ncbi:MAG: DUF4405 domain-containing protein [Pirellulales bacterium]|nr:DUF4405 domain-containing protein [Pirellulales bacterium]